MQTLYTTWRLFVKNELQNHAAATAFYFLLSAAPVVLLLTYGAQYLAGLAEASNLAALLLAALHEQLNLDALAALGVIPKQTQIAASGVGLVTLLISSRGLVSALQSAFRVIFPDEGKRTLVLDWSLPLLIIPLVLVLVVLAVVFQTSLDFFARVELLGAYETGVLKAINAGLALLAVWGLLYLTYHRLPLVHPPHRAAMLVAALATATLLALFTAFGEFFRVERYQSIYGALGGVVFALIGAYLACVAVLFWAQLLYAVGKVDLVALEKLFLGNDAAGSATGTLEGRLFARHNRLLAKYGRVFAAGADLMREGDDSRDAVYVFAGRVGIYKRDAEGERRLAELAEGNLIGEMAYLLDERRTASVRAETEVTALVLPPAMLEQLMRFSAPLSRRIIAALAQRLMHTTQAQGRQFPR